MRTLTLTLTIFFLTNTIIGQGQNLISNWKFQDDNMAIKCDDWYNSCGQELTVNCDTFWGCMVSFYNQSPSLLPEDVWSLQLDASFPQESFVETYITGQSGTHIYQLKYFMKSDTTSGNNSTGFASLGTGTQNQYIASQSLSDTTSFWQQFAFSDTLTTQPTDTITVRLSAGICDFCVNRVYFDFIELTVTDTLTSIKKPDKLGLDKIKIYPNPTLVNITIEIEGSKSENRTLIIYNSAGQLIKTIQTNKNIVIIEKDYVKSGLYFFQIHKTTDMKLIGQGKFIIQ